MKIIAFSDSHQNFFALDRICQIYHDADLYIHLGDGEGDAELLLQRRPEIPLLCVHGNCDWMQQAPLERQLFLRAERVLAIHGHSLFVKQSLFPLEKYARSLNAQVVLFGHTHTPLCDFRNGLWIVNPGSTVYHQSLRFALVEVTQESAICRLLHLPRDT